MKNEGEKTTEQRGENREREKMEKGEEQRIANVKRRYRKEHTSERVQH